MTSLRGRRGAALLLTALCSLTAISTTLGCQLNKFLEYAATFQDMYTCTKPQRSATPFLIDQSTLLTTQFIRLDDCVHDGDKRECDELIAAFGSESDNNIFKYFATKMTDSPEDTCPCITQYDSLLDECSAVIDQFTNYCNKFYYSGSDNNDNKIVDGVKQCVMAVERACPNTDLHRSQGSFNSTFSCVTSHLVDLEGECEAIFSSVLSGLYRACASDLYELCAVESSSLSPARALKCLMSHYSSISSSCRSQLDDLGANVVPCAKEAEVFCADKYTPEDVVLCLSGSLTERADRFSTECVDLLDGLSNCLPSEGSPSELSDDADDSHGAGDDNSYYGDDNSYYAPGDGDDDYYAPPKPKPRPEDDFVGDDRARPKPKPVPDDDRFQAKAVFAMRSERYLRDKQGSRLYRIFNSNARSNVRDINGAGNGAPKKQPCWQPGDGGKKKPPRDADDDSINDRGDDYAASSATDQQQENKGHNHGPDDHELRGPALGALASFAIAAALLMGVLGLVWYKNNQSFDNLTAARVAEIIRASLPRVPSLSAQTSNNGYVRVSQTAANSAPEGGDDLVEGIQLQTLDSGGKGAAHGGEITATSVVVNPMYVSAGSELEV